MATVPGIVLSCGGYRSGSTYAYNLVGEYVERANAGRRIGYLEPEQVPLLEGLESVVAALGVAVGKAHHSPAIPEGGRWGPLLAAGRLLPVCTLRDWRDVVHSFSRVYRQTPQEVLDSRRWRVNADNVRWWLQAGALPVAYDELLADPLRLLREVCARTGTAYDDAVAEAAAAACGSGPDGAGEFDAGADRRTLLHDGHVATPAGGGWRQWDEITRAEVEQRVAPLQRELAAPPGGGQYIV